MKKLLLSLLLTISFVSTSVFAFEWGGVFKNESNVSIRDITRVSDVNAYSFNQGDSLYLWANKGLTSDSSWYLSAEAFYKFKMGYTGGAFDFKHIVDLDLLKVTGQVVTPNTVLNIAVGRFFVIDNSATIFTQTCDGVSVKVSFPFMDLSVYSGFTGLLNSLNIAMLDENGIATPALGASDLIYSLSHSYVPLIVSAEFPTFAGVQTLGIQASAYLDATTQNQYNRFYANIMMKGPIVGSLFYSFNTTFGFPNFKQFTNLTEFTIAGYAADSIALYAGVKYASGNHGIFSSFRGVTSAPAYNSYTMPDISGMLIPSLKVIFNFQTFGVSIDSKYVISCPGTDMLFSGLGFDLAVDYNIFSDLQLSLYGQVYADLVGKDSASDSNYKAGINLSFSF